MIHNSTDADAASEEDGPPVQILFIFSSCALGALVRLVTKRIALPYTVVMFAFGAAFGAVGQMVPHLRKEIEHSEVNPHTILYVFLPVLIFESAYAMEAHMFFKSFPQITILALPGLGIATLLTAGFSSYVFGYGWGWGVSLMFGSIVSATDPVAVVAVLKDVGAAKQLSILLEGESLLNDGVAIVLYHVFNWMAKGEMTTVKIIRYSIQVSFGGVGFGFFMAKTTIFWLRNIFNDALAEITITLASTYLTFYIAEAYLNVSGVVSVVVLGVTLNNERTCVSPEVETFLHRHIAFPLSFLNINNTFSLNNYVIGVAFRYVNCSNQSNTT
ncbi:Sodium/hydrogen exchanger 7 [Lamellibrachia satsuma]|nr:Sodium/hydrogen exchanger 7 [Lamellibrachia satsuma]